MTTKGSIIFNVTDKATPFFMTQKKTSTLYPVTILTTKKTLEGTEFDV